MSWSRTHAHTLSCATGCPRHISCRILQAICAVRHAMLQPTSFYTGLSGFQLTTHTKSWKKYMACTVCTHLVHTHTKGVYETLFEDNAASYWLDHSVNPQCPSDASDFASKASIKVPFYHYSALVRSVGKWTLSTLFRKKTACWSEQLSVMVVEFFESRWRGLVWIVRLKASMKCDAHCSMTTFVHLLSLKQLPCWVQLWVCLFLGFKLAWLNQPAFHSFYVRTWLVQNDFQEVVLALAVTYFHNHPGFSPSSLSKSIWQT